MKISVIDCGSLTLKFRFLEASNKTTGKYKFNRLSHGVIDRIDHTGSGRRSAPWVHSPGRYDHWPRNAIH